MDISTSLQDFGLKPNEIKIYLYLLENGLSSPAQIAKGIGILRTNGYHILRSLAERGLVDEQQGKGGRKVYGANDPSAFLRALDSQRETMSRILPDLRSLYATEKNKPSIKFYAGLKQIQEIYTSALDTKELYALGSTRKLFELMPDFMEKWTREVKKRGIVLRDIVSAPSTKQITEKMKDVIGGTYAAKALPESAGEIVTDLLLWNDHLALITLEEPFFGTVITEKNTARTFKVILELLGARL